VKDKFENYTRLDKKRKRVKVREEEREKSMQLYSLNPTILPVTSKI
jgi:hypothetical protein